MIPPPPPPSRGRPGGLTRRRFLAGTSLVGAAGLLGCSSSRGERQVDLGGARNVDILTWSDYIDPDEGDLPGTVTRFGEATGVSVGYVEEYSDNASAWADLLEPSLSAGRSVGYDIVVPTNWLAARMAGLGYLEPLPLEVIPNHVNIDPAFLTLSWDRGARFHMPWQAGITGIAYDPAATGRDITSIADLFDPTFAGRVGAVVEMRETVGFAMLLNGDDPSRPTRTAAENALETLARQQFTYTANEFADGLSSGDLALAMAWSGDIVQLQRQRPDLRFVIPDEGAIQWFDTMVIPRGAPNVAAAGAWMDFAYDPVNAARISAWVQFISPVVGVRDELLALGGEAAELAQNPILFPDDDTRNRLFTWGGLPTEDELALEARFEELLATAG